MFLLALARPAIPGHRTIVTAHSRTISLIAPLADLPLLSSIPTDTCHCLECLSYQLTLISYSFAFCLTPPAAAAARRSRILNELERHTDEENGTRARRCAPPRGYARVKVLLVHLCICLVGTHESMFSCMNVSVSCWYL